MGWLRDKVDDLAGTVGEVSEKFGLMAILISLVSYPFNGMGPDGAVLQQLVRRLLVLTMVLVLSTVILLLLGAVLEGIAGEKSAASRRDVEPRP